MIRVDENFLRETGLGDLDEMQEPLSSKKHRDC